MKVTLDLDETYSKAVDRRIDELQSKRAEEIRKAGSEELAAEIEESDPDAGNYLKSLVKQDLRDSGVIEE